MMLHRHQARELVAYPGAAENAESDLHHLEIFRARSRLDLLGLGPDAHDVLLLRARDRNKKGAKVKNGFLGVPCEKTHIRPTRQHAHTLSPESRGS